MIAAAAKMLRVKSPGGQPVFQAASGDATAGLPEVAGSLPAFGLGWFMGSAHGLMWRYSHDGRLIEGAIFTPQNLARVVHPMF